MINKILNVFIKTPNQKTLERLSKKVKKINEKEKELELLTDTELKEKFLNIKKEVKEKTEIINNKYNLLNTTPAELDNVKKELKKEYNKILEPYIIDIFAMVREASKRILGMRHFDVQLIGGMVLHEGKIAEMKTGEGKTLVASLPAILNSLIGKPIYIVTVNDYLAKRDAEFLKPLYEFFDLKVGIIQEGQLPIQRQEEYKKDIIYVTNSELGFDYLKDNLARNKEEQVLNELFYAIIDEVDSILIDEARTPLIISGPFEDENLKELIIKANEIVKYFENEKDFEIDYKNRTITMTESGLEKQEMLWNVQNVYDENNAILGHLLMNALKAHYLFENGKDYIVKTNPETNKKEVLIIDTFTGRIGEGRKYSEGLHQALEAKESVEITAENKKEAEITYQMFFKLFTKLSGMTGTAQNEATEFINIYNLDVISIPTNKPVIRKDLPDLFFTDQKSKIKALVKKIEEINKTGQPVLVGTTSIEKSEIISKELKKLGIKHTLLNAKYHEQEAEIIAQAGKKGAITIATNMAGRGTDIKLDEESKKLGGLYVIGSERYENRRIDDQLIGRSGRQGDPGISQFYIALDDELIKIFGNPNSKIMKLLTKKQGKIGESETLTKMLKKAQKKLENLNFEARKNIFEYDQVIDIQRKTIYHNRQNIIENNYDLLEKLKEYINIYINHLYEIAKNDWETFPLKDFRNVINEQHPNNLLSKEDNEIVGFQFLLLTKINIFIDIDKKDKTEIEIINEISELLNNIIIEKLQQLYQILIEENNKYKIDFKDFSNNILKDNFIKIIDIKWIEHLYVMDIIKEGIRLRNMAQKDPLIEFKKEAYTLFEQLIENIKKGIAEDILKEAFEQNIKTPQKNENDFEELIGKHVEEIFEKNDSNNVLDIEEIINDEKIRKNILEEIN